MVRTRAAVARLETADRFIPAALSGLVLIVVVLVLTGAHTGATVALN